MLKVLMMKKRVKITEGIESSIVLNGQFPMLPLLLCCFSFAPSSFCAIPFSCVFFTSFCFNFWYRMFSKNCVNVVMMI